MNIVETFRGKTLTETLEQIRYRNLPWLVKRLSGNDTGLTGGHQAGIYIPQTFAISAFPEIAVTSQPNPDAVIENCIFPNHDHCSNGLRAIYYNSKIVSEKGTRNEFRITRWGGRGSPVQNVENTGSIWLLAVSQNEGKYHAVCWVSESPTEEDLIEEWLGVEVEPGRFYFEHPDLSAPQGLELPDEWFSKFPSGGEIFEFVCRQLPAGFKKLTVDSLLLKRRNLEFELFSAIERRSLLPAVKEGFDSVDDFIRLAHTVSNRRKSRTGRSLELNLAAIFSDEQLLFDMQAVTENNKKPDFLFPSGRDYHDRNFTVSKLHMLAAKTCCKDRWRQILNEADRIPVKHLFTLQEGISDRQLEEMNDNRVQLVVPASHRTSFSRQWRDRLLSLGDFIEVRRDSQKRLMNRP